MFKWWKEDAPVKVRLEEPWQEEWNRIANEMAQKYGFNGVLITGKDEWRYMTPEDRITMMEGKLLEFSKDLKNLRMNLSYPQFRDMRLTKGYDGVRCSECGDLVTMVEEGGRTLVACSTCGKAARASSKGLKHGLDAFPVFYIPLP